MTLLSLKNPYYEFSKIDEVTDITKYTNTISTFYVVQGKLEFEIDNKKIDLNSGEGILVSPESKIKKINKIEKTVAFEVVSTKTKSALTEIIDKDNKLIEENIKNFKILKNHKKVIKPWGYELWIVWLKDYHVLKKIYMKKGFKCSLQFHENKYETNFLLSGKAKILKNFHIDKNSSASEAKELIKNVDLLRDYSKDVDAPYNFTNIPGEVHRVFSLEDYIAYEVSTPELDDVIRIQDDTSRKSGRIISEHEK